MTNPTDLDDETIARRINYEGFPFQRAILNEIRNAKHTVHGTNLGYNVKEEWPINIQNHPEPLKSNTIDILAWKREKDSRLDLLIECKRPNPERKIWVFVNDSEIGKLRQYESIPLWSIHNPAVSYYDLCHGHTLKLSDNYFHAAHAMEIVHKKEKGGRRKPRSSKVVMDACLQASAATIGRIQEMEEECKGDWPPSENGINYMNFLPMVITTAELYSFKCKTSEDTIRTGDIDFNDMELQKEKWLIYHFPLSLFLFKETEIFGQFDDIVVRKLPVLIINSKHLAEFLNEISF